MLRFEGEREFPISPDALFAKLRDAAFLVTCIPEATVEGQPTLDQAACNIRPGFACVRGTLKVSMAIVDAVKPTSFKLLLQSKGIGTASEVESVLTIAATEAGGARVHWSADVTRLAGLLTAVPAGLIRGAAQKTIEDIWTEIAAKVS